MFADACEIAWRFTRRAVIMSHCVDGECRPNVGSFIIVNDEGWFLSSWHLKEAIDQIDTTAKNVAIYKDQVVAIEGKKGLSGKQRHKLVRELQKPPAEAATAYTVWWSKDGVKAVDISGIPQADLLLGRLDPFDPKDVTGYPSFKDPGSKIRQGTSLCRLGYPFPTVKATYDEAANHFTFTNITAPEFAIEGILTRQVEIGTNPAGYRNMYLETSSAGLKGQSGGPIIDVRGVVWGIQSHTRNLSLGFDPKVPVADGGKHKGAERSEHQFLNVGWATHPETIVGLLREKGIKHTLQA